MTHSLRLTKGFLTAFLASVYILGFIITPYWRLHASLWENLFYLALTISIGLIWLLLSTGSLQIEFTSKDIGLFLFLLAGIAILNYRPLNSVIPFRGDETSHIERTLVLMSRVPSWQSIVIIILFLTFMVAGIKEQKWGIYVGILIVVCTAVYFLGKNSFEDVISGSLFFLRWPFFNYWFFAALPKLVSLVTSPYHEALYRIIPMLSMIAVCWIWQRKVGSASLVSKIAWGFAIATLPLVFYYSSILYIEPPAVFLMTIVCFDLERLLQEDRKALLQFPSWYALLFIGFIKETTLPFLLGFLGVRAIVQWRAWSKKALNEKSARTLLHLLIGELGIVFSVLAPIALYLYFRFALTPAAAVRSYDPALSNLLDPGVYSAIARSLLEQFGLFLLFFIGGCILLARNRNFILLFGYLSIILVVLGFFTLDLRGYAGYSRFNLFILPPILAGSIGFVNWAAKQKQYVTSILILFAIGSNVWLSPVHLDGAKTAYWGNYLSDTSEHYYPYQDALVWLKDNYPQKRMLFVGVDFYYPFQFYWNKLDWKPRRDAISFEGISDETLAISKALQKAESEHYSIVVYRLIGRDVVLPREMGEFRVQTIRNSAHTLLIFYRP